GKRTSSSSARNGGRSPPRRPRATSPSRSSRRAREHAAMRQNLGTFISATSTDQWLAFLQQGKAFSKGGVSTGAPGQFPHAQLFNPAASGKTVIVHGLIVDTSGVFAVHFNVDNVARATDAGAGVNMLSGGAAGVAHFRTESNAAEQGAVFNSFSPPTQTPIQPYFGWFFQMTAGQGLTLVGVAAAVGIEVNFPWAGF